MTIHGYRCALSMCPCRLQRTSFPIDNVHNNVCSSKNSCPRTDKNSPTNRLTCTKWRSSPSVSVHPRFCLLLNHFVRHCLCSTRQRLATLSVSYRDLVHYTRRNQIEHDLSRGRRSRPHLRSSVPSGLVSWTHSSHLIVGINVLLESFLVLLS